MKDRIRRIRKDSGLNQTEFGSEIGATQAMITSYETGRVMPDDAKRLLICEKFNVNPDWLETGDGNPYKTGLLPRLAMALKSAPAIETALSKLVDRMTLEDWKILNAVVEKAIKKEE